jgi:hypothetical protein
MKTQGRWLRRVITKETSAKRFIDGGTLLLARRANEKSRDKAGDAARGAFMTSKVREPWVSYATVARKKSADLHNPWATNITMAPQTPNCCR